MFLDVIGSANAGSPFADNLSFPLVATVAVGVAALLAFVLIRTARVRRHPQAGPIIAIGLLWAFVSAGSVVWYVIQQTKWASEESLRLGTGYVDPGVAGADAPAAPAALWFFLGLGYAGLVVWATAHRRRPPYE